MTADELLATLDSILPAWGFAAGSAAPLSGGLINATFAVREPDGTPRAVVQRLHPVFGAAVNDDLDAVTAHLAARGLVTPRLVRTLEGRRWIEADGGVWRALTWVDGVTVHRVQDIAFAEAGGALVARFHRAVADLEHDYAFARAGVHDTAAHLAKLASIVAANERLAGNPWFIGDAVGLGREVLTAAASLPALGALRRRHTHGDLKISNLLFSTDTPPTGVCLLDLDTLGLQTIAFELGDAMRSWCNRTGEDVAAPVFDLPIFAAAMRGYGAEGRGLLDPAEIASIVDGLHTCCVELAARFCVDVFEDRYFGWDRTRFPSRRAHNLVRARGQLALAASVAAQRDAALAAAHDALG